MASREVCEIFFNGVHLFASKETRRNDCRSIANGTDRATMQSCNCAIVQQIVRIYELAIVPKTAESLRDRLSKSQDKKLRPLTFKEFSV